MASTSMAMTRPRTTQLNKTTRQIVPAFLQKLFEMVSDPAHSDLIQWSEAGDSFYVLDHERFAREVLGRWFKHQNFSSFVRQLNMYGFHKVPHLQQGALKNDSETDHWNFEHPNFRRGQPDLLCLITRKKQQAQHNDDHAAASTSTSGLLAVENGHDGAQHSHQPSSSSSAGRRMGSPITMQANQVLDVNALVNGISAIKRHQTAISADLNDLKTSNAHLWQEAMDSRERHKNHQDTINRILKFLAGVFGQGVNISTPSGEGEPDNDDAVNMAPIRTGQLLIGDGRDSDRSRFSSVDSPTPTDILNSAPEINALNSPALAMPDAGLQQAFSQMLQSPAQMRKVLAAVAAQSQHSRPSSPAPPNTNGKPTPQRKSSALLPYVSSPSPPYSTPNFARQEDRLQRTYTDTNEISADVDKLDDSINSLIQSLGLDPNFQSAEGGQPSAYDTFSQSLPQATEAENFDLDAFLSDLNRTSNGTMDDAAYMHDFNPAHDNPAFVPQTPIRAGLSGLADQDGEINEDQQLLSMPPLEQSNDSVHPEEPLRVESPVIKAGKVGHLKRKSGTAGMDSGSPSTETKPTTKSRRKK